MKPSKLIAFCVVLLTLFVSAGCSEKPFPEPELTYEVIFGAENADPCGVTLCLELRESNPGTSVLSDVLARRAFFAVSGDTIRKINASDVPQSTAKQPGLNKKARAEWKRKLNTAGNALGVWSDTGLWYVSVAEGTTYLNKKNEKETVEYEGKEVVCEVTDGKVYYSVLSPSGAQTEFRSAYSGRIGDRYYDSYWWYDLSAHELKLYASDDELPPVTNVDPPDWYELRLPDGRKVTEMIEEDIIGNAGLLDRVGDTAYYLFGSNNRYSDADGGYSGDTALFVIYDCKSARVLRVERYDCANLNVRSGFIMAPEEY